MVNESATLFVVTHQRRAPRSERGLISTNDEAVTPTPGLIVTDVAPIGIDAMPETLSKRARPTVARANPVSAS